MSVSWKLRFLDNKRIWLNQKQMQATYFSISESPPPENGYFPPFFCSLVLNPSFVFEYNPFEGTLAKMKDVVKQQSKQNEERKPKWTVAKRSYAFWLKFYAEQVGMQIPEGKTMLEPDDDRPKQEWYLREFLNRLLLYASENCGDKFKFHGIVHTKDELKDNFFHPSVEKAHVHLLCVFNRRIRFSSCLKLLQQVGYVIREEDETLTEESDKFPDLRKKQHIAMIVYHTHETDKAKEDGKYIYDRSSCVTNYSDAELQKMYDEYFTQMSCTKLYADKYDIILKCRELGERAEDWQPFFDSLPISIRVQSGLKKSCEQEYNAGIKQYMSRSSGFLLNRCCIFISGVASAGKTVNSKLALADGLGLKVHTVEGGGTGKLDELRPCHDGLVISDSSIGDNILAMADNSVVRVYRRNSDNAIWRGKYLVITYNYDFDTYLDNFYPWVNRQAAHSRFFICQTVFDPALNHFRLKFDLQHTQNFPLRGTKQDKEEKIYMLYAFLRQYNKFSMQYTPDPTNGQSTLAEFNKYFTSADYI